MYSKKEIDDKFAVLKSQIDEIDNNNFQNLIKRKRIIIETKKSNWIEILDVSDIHYEYSILSIWINKHNTNIYHHISCDRLKSNKIQIIYSYLLHTYFACIGDYCSDLPLIITIDYLQVPSRIKVSI